MEVGRHFDLIRHLVRDLAQRYELLQRLALRVIAAWRVEDDAVALSEALEVRGAAVVGLREAALDAAFDMGARNGVNPELHMNYRSETHLEMTRRSGRSPVHGMSA